MTEAKNCQNCKKEFVIEDDDFSFYEKIKVPPPTFCPECRLQRRLVWMKGLQLFKRKCDLCKKEKFSMYAPDAPYIVYCDRCWWSDSWDYTEFGKKYDATRPFLEQVNELLHTTPLPALFVDKVTAELSPFTNHVGKSKNCYLIFYSEHNEDSAYGCYLKECKNVYDCAPIMNSENCFDSGNIFRCFNVVGCFNGRNNIDSYFLSGCDNCAYCFGSVNLRNKKYVFFNEQLSKDEYQEKMQKLDLGSYASYIHWKEEARKHWKKFPPKPTYDDFSVNSTGSYYFHSRNCKECYEVLGAEDSKYLMLIKEGPVRDSYDYTDWGYNAQALYECMTVGEDVQNVKFTHESGFGISDVEYSKLSIGGSNHFGCVSIKSGKYCILNKKYTKEEYETLKERIIQDMNERPYISVSGHVYRYGEFFPPEFSPCAYNDSFASRFFPKTQQEVQAAGLRWFEPEKKEYAITLESGDLPDQIQDVKNSILKETICCKECNRGFKIIPQELQFLKSHILPLSRLCPFCRIWKKIDHWVQNLRLHTRICNFCSKSFMTHYSEETAPYIYCKECYQKEIL